MQWLAKQSNSSRTRSIWSFTILVYWDWNNEIEWLRKLVKLFYRCYQSWLTWLLFPRLLECWFNHDCYVFKLYWLEVFLSMFVKMPGWLNVFLKQDSANFFHMFFFSLKQIFNGVFLKVNKATVNMLQRVEPYVTYGCVFLSLSPSGHLAFINICSSKFAWSLINWLCMFIDIPTWRVWGNWSIKEDMESWTSRELVLCLITPFLNKFVIPR